MTKHHPLKSYYRASTRNKINISITEYENEQMYPIYCSGDKFKDHMELLLLKRNLKIPIFT